MAIVAIVSIQGGSQEPKVKCVDCLTIILGREGATAHP